jgi:hypothetical protein
MTDKSKPKQDRSKSNDFSPSHGTGVHSQPNFNRNEYNEVSPSGDNIDAARFQVEVSGEEGVGGTAPTPDQDIVDELGAAVGLEMDDKTDLRTTDALEQRDAKRWELEPKSSEDYEERRES